MTDHQHKPIAPPMALMQWWREHFSRYRNAAEREERLIERAAEWGYDQRGEVNEAKLQKARDQELEACCDWLRHEDVFGEELALRLRSARRPPPSLKAQALEELGEVRIDPEGGVTYAGLDLIRRALEALPDD